MPDLFAILISIATGGSAAAMVTGIANELSKRRHNEIEIKKHRMEILSQYVSLYNRLALYTNWNISWKIREDEKKNNIDYPLIMYYVCDFLHLRKQLIHSLGTLQFDNLQAEDIINDLERAIVALIKQGFNEIEFSKLSCLVDDITPYHKFYEKINESENKELLDKFKELIDKNEIKKNLEKNCRYYSELIMLELGHIYKIWYKQEPKFSKLSPDLKEKLRTEYLDYYNRISKF